MLAMCASCNWSSFSLGRSGAFGGCSSSTTINESNSTGAVGYAEMRLGEDVLWACANWTDATMLLASTNEKSRFIIPQARKSRCRQRTSSILNIGFARAPSASAAIIGRKRMRSNEKEISHGRVSWQNTFRLPRNGAVGFVDWLDHSLAPRIDIRLAAH